MRKNLAAPEQATPWIYNPWLDLIIGCGAWSAPLLLISYLSVASSARTWSVVFYVLAFFFNYPHYMATLYRAYRRAEDFQKYRVFTVHITALMVLTLVLSHSWLKILPWIFTIYLTWSPWHYSGQNYGLFMMFARRAGADPDKTTRRMLYSAFIASYLILFLGFHTGPSSDPLFLSLGIPVVIGRWEQGILCVTFVAVSTAGLSRLARGTSWRKLIPSLTLFSSQFLWFLLPSAISLVQGWDVPQSRYSSGVLAVMHSAQYLWITSYYARREGESEKTSRGWRPFAYFAILVVGGIALFVPGPWLASRAFHHDFTASFLIFTALVNIHHFILDGAIWKLRDGRIASLLLNSREKIADAANQAGGGLADIGRWLVGDSRPAHALRLSLASLLLLWGTVDQARYYLALRGDDLRDLERAERLNAFDSTLQMRLARRAAEEGQPQQAEAAWRRAIQANPADPAARQALLQFLIDRDRYDDAFALTEASLRLAPNDTNLLIDRGLLELRNGKNDLARADWERALEIDPSQMNAHLYLASELDKEGKAQTAAAHYNAFLQSIAQRSAEERPPADRVIAIVLRMADCQARSAQPVLAVKSYRLAETLAAQTHQAKLESMASVNEAQLQVKMGGLARALPLYQRALQLDEFAGDVPAEASDWMAYGKLLENSGFSPRVAYACLVKAENLLRATGKDSPSVLVETRVSLEKKLGSEAASIRRDPGAAAEEALALRR